MQKVKEFSRTGGKVLKASLMIGRQPNKRIVDGAGDFVALNAGQGLHPQRENTCIKMQFNSVIFHK